MTAIEAQTGNGLSLLLSCPTGARSARCPQKKNRLHDGLYRQADIPHGAGFAVLQYVMRQGFPDYCKNLRYNCHNDEILVETEYIENKGAVGEDEAMVPSSSSACKYKNYKEVEKRFKEAGFINISTEILYDIVLGWTEEGEVESVQIDSKSDFTRGEIFKKDTPIVITYHMKEDDDPNKEAEATAPTKSEDKYNLDRDLIVTQCDRDSEKQTMYHIAFATRIEDGKSIIPYTFDTIINPRAMGDEFNAIGPLPDWFYVGATVHVKAQQRNGTIYSCVVTQAEDSTENEDTVTVPVMPGSSLDTIVSVAKEYGLSNQYDDENWGHGTKMHTMASDGLTIDIVYSTETKEALFVSIVSFSNLSTEKEQKEFIKAIAGIACPQDDADDVSDWVKDTIGISGSVTINNVTYELEIGPNGNLCYSVGQPEWEAWESSFN